MTTAGAVARLSDAGLSLWLTNGKFDRGGAWTGRRLMALEGGAAAGYLDFFVHPDGQAVSVKKLEVYPSYRKRHLASVLMDALYAAYPTAWINHGNRSEEDGARWWDRYTDPAPERNIHNRPPAEWAPYFDARSIGRDRATNAFRNRAAGVHGHRDAVHRYGQRTEAEDLEYVASFRQATAPYANPAHQELHGGLLLFLPPGLHRYVHDGTRDISERAQALLDHVGHGNLPRAKNADYYTGSWSTTGFWDTTAHDAFDDAAQAEAFLRGRDQRVSTHVVFHALPLAEANVPLYSAAPSHVLYTDQCDIPMNLAGLSWRTPSRPWEVHREQFTPPLAASLPPLHPADATPAYRARYTLNGRLRPEAAVESAQTSSAASQARRVQAFADKISRSAAKRTPPAPAAPPARQDPHQRLPPSPEPPSPRLR
ncbi:GNAT family N-acetyltransferase [Streptomyces sp. NPDC020883]|uniref:GNAT family N-acetyltransferase n=1 Tax=Streptomyces sp. NPDC020883 TaxID=3365099 RepID=UPI0037A831BD